MIICPKCGRHMVLRQRNKDNHEFYGCSGYPNCYSTINVEDAHKYDDGKKGDLSELTIEEQGERIYGNMRNDGWNHEDANYARHMWEKDE